MWVQLHIRQIAQPLKGTRKWLTEIAHSLSRGNCGFQPAIRFVCVLEMSISTKKKKSRLRKFHV
jgi:hypothetical protein